MKARRLPGARTGLLDDAQARDELMLHLRRSLDDVAGGRLAGVAAATPGQWQPIGHYTRGGEVAKVALDVVAAALLVALASPLALAIAYALRLEGPGPVFVRQRRIGRGGRPFDYWRFRTRHLDSRHGADGSLEPAAEDAAPACDAGDPRRTRVGAWLERTHLADAPALVDVLLGHMSLVGPRAEMPEVLPYCGSAARLLVAVRPGLLSLSTLLAPPGAPFRDALEHDLRYVRERSPRLDLGIALGTLAVALTGRRPPR